MARKKDTNYAAISARLRVLENRLLTRERMEQLIEAREDAECTKLMVDCGYPEPAALTLPELEVSLAKAQAELFADLERSTGDPDVLAVFQVKYDYHNAKALIKSQARDVDAAHLLVEGGVMTLRRWQRASETARCRRIPPRPSKTPFGQRRICWLPPRTLSRRISCWTRRATRRCWLTPRPPKVPF